MKNQVNTVSSKLKILFVHEVSYEEKVVFEMHEFPELLALRGHEVIFIDYPEHARHSLFQRRCRQLVMGRAFLNAQIMLYSTPNYLVQPLGRIIAFFCSFRFTLRVISKERPDVIVLYGVPTNGIQTIRAAKKFAIPVVHRAIDVSHLLRPGILSTLVPLIEKYVYKKSDLVLSNNAALAEYITTESGQRACVRVLAPGVKEIDGSDTIVPEPKFDFVFMGTLFRFSGLDWVLQELASNDAFSERTMLVIGAGEAENKLKRLVKQLNLTSRVKFTGRVEFDALHEFVTQGRVGLLPFDESLVARLALPGKVLQYLNFGLPTVSTRLDGLMSFLPQDFGVVYSKPGREFLEVASNLCDSPEKISQMVSKGQKHLVEIANWTDVIQELEDILIKLQIK